jgi:hypothetical protein
MPDVGLLVNPRRKKRMCGLRPGAPSFPSSHHNSTAVTPAAFAGCNGPLPVTQIGVLGVKPQHTSRHSTARMVKTK